MKDNQYGEVDRQISNELMQYAITKYGGEFEVVFYETASDATQNYVLCLKDNKGRIFNVFEHAKTGKCTDDYKNSIVDNKMHEYLSEYLNISKHNGSIGVMAIMNIDVDVVTLDELSLEECIEQFGLYSLVFTYHLDGSNTSIYKNHVEIIDIYNKLTELETDTIDFNVVVTSGDGLEVEKILNNMRYRYSGSWYSYDGVDEYISEVNPKFGDVDELMKLVKE